MRRAQAPGRKTPSFAACRGAGSSHSPREHPCSWPARFSPRRAGGCSGITATTAFWLSFTTAPKTASSFGRSCSGRQRNEFMNSVTLPSVAIGALLLVLLAFSLLAVPEFRLIALVALTAGLAPISPFLPPGFPLYFGYRSYWKKARLMRAQRDVIRLPLRYFPPSVDWTSRKKGDSPSGHGALHDGQGNAGQRACGK